MGNLNKVMLIGRLTSDPEKRVTKNGISVASLNLVTNDRFKDNQGCKQESSEFHKIVLWGKVADLAEQYLSKGSRVYIEGKLQTNEWNDKDGNKRYTTEIVGQTMQFIETKNSGSNNNQSQQRQSSHSSYDHKNGNPLNYNQVDDNFIDDDLIPF